MQNYFSYANRSGPVIEPSEIFTGRDDEAYTQSRQANPWIRFTARFFDYSLFFAVLHFVSAPVFLPVVGRFIPIEYLAWIPIETFLLMTWGGTPGKWLLCTEIRKGFNKRLPFRCAFRRSLLVYFRGVGMGIPVINVLCMLHAFYRLRLFPLTTWDRDVATFVIHRPLAKWRYFLATGVVIAGMIFYSFWKTPVL